MRDRLTVVVTTSEMLSQATTEMERLRSPGALALAHFAAVRVLLESIAALPGAGGRDDRAARSAHRGDAQAGAAQGRATLDLWHDRSLDPLAELLALGEECGALVRDWRVYTVGGLLVGKNQRQATRPRAKSLATGGRESAV